jgi:thiamine biosynthesis lipoprotein
MRRVLIPESIASMPPVAVGEVVALRGETMGTTWSVQMVAPGIELERLHDWQCGIQEQLDLVVAQMSHWRDHSDLSRFNRAAAGSWHRLPEAFFEVLSYALSVAADSRGSYDPTAGALVNAWGFGPAGRYDEPGFQPPTAHAVEAARAQCGWRQLAVDSNARAIRQPGNLQLDLSAVAKGYGVDRVAGYLENRGIAHYLVEVGGELRGAGVKPDQMPWWVELEQPLTRATQTLPETIVALHGLAIATSGDYRRFYKIGEMLRVHTIDPRTGHPIRNGVASVTVLHASCMAADALSTALTVLGADDGFDFAQRRGLAARFLVRTGAGIIERTSAAFTAMLQ